MLAPPLGLLRSFQILNHGHINDAGMHRLMHPLKLFVTLTKWGYGSALKDTVEQKNLFFYSLSSFKWLHFKLLVENVAVYAISTFMLVESSVKEFISLRPRKREKR